MMWSKNTNGNLMIGKGKDGKRAEGRGGETRNWNGRLSGDLAERTLLSGESPCAPSNSSGFCGIVVPPQVEVILQAINVSQEVRTVRRSLLSPTARPCIHRETKSTQDVGTGAAVKTIDDVECRVRDGKSAIGRTWDGVFAKSLRAWRGRESGREGPKSSPTDVFPATDIRFALKLTRTFFRKIFLNTFRQNEPHLVTQV